MNLALPTSFKKSVGINPLFSANRDSLVFSAENVSISAGLAVGVGNGCMRTNASP